MDISMRLRRIAGMVSRGACVCDVGTDHGYLAIYLVKEQIASRVIAMDVAKGPLGKARDNIKAYACENEIETRLSDGVDQLKDGEASTVIMAGMGGMLIQSLLKKGEKKLQKVEEIILSPHTDVRAVRQFLWENHYRIVQEDFLKDEGKYYVIMKAVHGDDSYANECEYRFGKLLLRDKNPVLKEFLQGELQKTQNIRSDLQKVNTDVARQRSEELKDEMQCIREGLRYYEM
ncbi:MAG: tRNA (adenine(22)-N(1))-methyltransferase [Lachnospiraceae bacterium]